MLRNSEPWFVSKPRDVQHSRITTWRKKTMQKRISWLLLTLAVTLTSQARADVDLVTIPRREGTQLTIYNSEDITVIWS